MPRAASYPEQYRRQPLLTFLRLLLASALLLLSGCGNSDSQEAQTEPKPAHKGDTVAPAFAAGRPVYQGDLDVMRKRGVIRALVTYNRTDFFIQDGQLRGIQVDFLHAFERQLNQGIKDPTKQISIQFLPVPFDQLIPAVENGHGDIAAHFLTVTRQREQRVAFATGKRMRVSEILVTNKEVKDIQSVDDLAGHEVLVLRGSSYVTHLRQLNKRLEAKGRKPVKIVQADKQLLSSDILELVNAGVADFTVVDDFRARLWAKVLPNIRLHENIRISSDNRVGWAIRKHSPQLQAALNRFINHAGQGTLLGNMLFRRYFDNTRWITDPNSLQDRDRLNRFMALFRKYGRLYGFSPLALAAQAYQESRLNPNLRSHRGAVGLMQLLPSTAASPHVGIPNISTPNANVHAAAKYLAFLRDRYFSDNQVAKQDRMAFTWAAYNAGPAKVRKMRQLAKKMGLNPRLWFGNTEVAAARLVGRETVDYVRNIYKYQLAYRLAQHAQSQQQAALTAEQ